MKIMERLFGKKRPVVAPEPRLGNRMRWIDDQWVEVCDFCGGNCGQCGTSVGAGIPFSMDTLIQNLHK